MNLPVSADAQLEWGLPTHPYFGTAFLIVTILYILVMLVLLLFFWKAMKKVPRAPKKSHRRKKTGKDGCALTNRPHTPHPLESETGSDP